MYAGPQHRAARGARRGDADRLPAAVVVRRRTHRPRLHRRVVGARRQRRQVAIPATSTTSGRCPATSAPTRPSRWRDARVQHKTTVDRGAVRRARRPQLGLPLPMAMPRGTTTDDIPAALRVADPPGRRRCSARRCTITSGTAAGRDDVRRRRRRTTSSSPASARRTSRRSRGVAAGDEVLIDNSVYLAFQTYHRHQVHPDFPVWDQFTRGRSADLPAAAELRSGRASAPGRRARSRPAGSPGR